MFFRNMRSAGYQGGALLYALTAYMLGCTGLVHESWFINGFATVLLAHGMIIAAYLTHECAHNTVFRDNKLNARLGMALGWLTGAAYGKYEDIRYKHFRHHVDNDDVVWFEYEQFFARYPLVLRLTRFFEWFYIPAHELIMHCIMVFTSYIIPERRSQRVYNTVVVAVRSSLFILVLFTWPKAALLYVVASLMMITVLRFMDGLQHDYGPSKYLFDKTPGPHKGDAPWEQAHTYSPVLSLKHVWLNWLVLNFGFHNAHHARPTTPWFDLPYVHFELFGDDETEVIPFSSQIKIFHRSRVNRVVHDGRNFPEYEGREYLKACQRMEVTGGNAASFLTSF